MLYYEPRIYSDSDYDQIKELIEDSKDMAYCTNVFIHPTYFTLSRDTMLPAFDTILKYSKQSRVAYLHCSELASWWKKRRDSRIYRLSSDEYQCDLLTDCVLKFDNAVKSIVADGIEIALTEKVIAGRKWKLAVLKSGQYSIKVVK